MRTSFFIALSVGATSALAADSCAKLYYQCGGRNWDGPTCCESGSKCQIQNEWYHQCVYDPTPQATTSVSDPCNDSQSKYPCANWYGQCGGNNWEGTNCCAIGSVCAFSNEFYSQCIPKPNSGPCQSIYGQCGGQGFSGATCCQEGTECVKDSEYYSQCRAIPGILSGIGPGNNDQGSNCGSTLSISAATTSSKFASFSNTTVFVTATCPEAEQSTSTTKCVTVDTTSTSTVEEPTPSTSTVEEPTPSTSVVDEPTTSSTLIDKESSAPVPSSTTSTLASSPSQSVPSPSSAVPSSPAENTIHFTPIRNGRSGTGVTTRYWDCCKPSCAWPGKADVSAPVTACGLNGVTPADPNAQSGCTGGDAYMCNDQQPFSINSTLAYGFAAASIAGSGKSQSCCSCMLLTFNDGPAAGKQMVTQITNTGSDLGSNHFDIAIPGGGVGIFREGCKNQWGVENGWGETYGGVSSEQQCINELPDPLKAGCEWRWDFLEGANNPSVSFVEIECPAEITAITGCKRNQRFFNSNGMRWRHQLWSTFPFLRVSL